MEEPNIGNPVQAIAGDGGLFTLQRPDLLLQRWLIGDKMTDTTDADLRARLNEELGFYPARLDPESIAEYRRDAAEERERHARYVRKYGGLGGSHHNQFRHIVKRPRT